MRIEIYHQDDQWHVRRQGESSPLSDHDTKVDAVSAGRQAAERESAELVSKPRARPAQRPGLTMPLPPGLSVPVDVALARAVDHIPGPSALPGGCRYEPKWDGYRAVVVVEDASARLYPRRGTDMLPRFPEVMDAAAARLSRARCSTASW